MSSSEYPTILVPVDFTEASDCAVNHAISLASALDYDIRLIHVLDKDSKAKLKKEGADEESLEDRLQKICEDIAIKSGKGAEYVLIEGSIFSTIGEVAEQIGAKYLIMGTHGVVGLQQKLLGAFAIKVITTSPVPTIVVQKRNIGEGYKKIIYPIDDTKGTKQKLNHIIHIAQKYDAEVYVFSAFERDEYLANAIDRNVNHAKKNLAAAGVKAHFDTAEDTSSDFGTQLIRYAAQVEADLIAIMTLTEMSLKEIILGPEAQRIINNDPQIAVMCVNPIESFKTMGGIVY